MVAKFTPNDVVAPENAFIQAAKALDAAGVLAQKKEDVSGLTEVAALFIELGVRLAAVMEEDDEVDEEAVSRKVPLGYCPPPAVVPVQEVELEDE